MIAIKINEVENARIIINKLRDIMELGGMPFSESLGRASDEEKAIIEVLRQIYQVDLPLLFQATDNLLATICDSFSQTDASLGAMFERG